MDTVDHHATPAPMGARTRLPSAATLVLGAAACAAVALAWTLSQPAEKQPTASASPAAQAPARAHAAGSAYGAASAAQAQPRRVYRYSIVPGGVTSREEVASAMAADKLVAAHYGGINVAALRTVTVAKARAVHVSYRKGDQIYWTAKTVMLAAGETLLTDGQNLIRARCGNRISDTAQQPVEGNGPAEQELDAYANAGDATAANLSMDDDDLPGGFPRALGGTAAGAGTAQAAAAGRSRAANALAEANPFQRLSSIPYSAGTISGNTEGSSAATHASTTGSTGSAGSASGAPSGTTPPLTTAGTNPSTTPVASTTPGTTTPDPTMPQQLAADPGAGTDPGTGTPGTVTQHQTSAGTTPGTTPGTSNPSPNPTGPTLLGNNDTPYVPPSGDTPKDGPSGLPSDPRLAPDPTNLPQRGTADTQAGAKSNDVPEPGTLWLGAAGVAAVLLARWRARKRR